MTYQDSIKTKVNSLINSYKTANNIANSNEVYELLNLRLVQRTLNRYNLSDSAVSAAVQSRLDGIGDGMSTTDLDSAELKEIADWFAVTLEFGA